MKIRIYLLDILFWEIFHFGHNESQCTRNGSYCRELQDDLIRHIQFKSNSLMKLTSQEFLAFMVSPDFDNSDAIQPLSVICLLEAIVRYIRP